MSAKQPPPSADEARLKPSFKMALALHAGMTWPLASTYSATPVAKQGGTTGYLVSLTLLLAGLCALAPTSPWARGFVFTDARWATSSQRTRRRVLMVLAGLLVAYLWVTRAG